MGPVDVSRSADLETEVQICPNGLLKLEIPFCFSLPIPPSPCQPKYSYARYQFGGILLGLSQSFVFYALIESITVLPNLHCITLSI